MRHAGTGRSARRIATAWGLAALAVVAAAACEAPSDGDATPGVTVTSEVAGGTAGGAATSAAPPAPEGSPEPEAPVETEAVPEAFVPPEELADLAFPEDCEHIETTREDSDGVQAWRLVFDCPSPEQAFAHVRERLEAKGYVYDGFAFWTLGTTRVALGGEHETGGGEGPGQWGMQVFRS